MDRPHDLFDWFTMARRIHEPIIQQYLKRYMNRGARWSYSGQEVVPYGFDVSAVTVEGRMMEQHMSVVDVGAPVAVIPENGSAFDYSTLDLTAQALSSVIAERDKVHALFARAQQNILEIGDALINVKDTIGHGNFGRWLDAEFGWSKATAGRFMQVAEQFRGISHVERFEPTALYALAAKNVPDDVRDQFIEQADTGQQIKHQDVRAALGKERKPKPGPTAIESVAEIVRLMVTAYDGQGIRAKAGFGRAVKSNLFEQEIDEYPEDEQWEIAEIIAAFGEACLKAAEPYQRG